MENSKLTQASIDPEVEVEANENVQELNSKSTQTDVNPEIEESHEPLSSWESSWEAFQNGLPTDIYTNFVVDEEIAYHLLNEVLSGNLFLEEQGPSQLRLLYEVVSTKLSRLDGYKIFLEILLPWYLELLDSLRKLRQDERLRNRNEEDEYLHNLDCLVWINEDNESVFSLSSGSTRASPTEMIVISESSESGPPQSSPVSPVEMESAAGLSESFCGEPSSSRESVELIIISSTDSNAGSEEHPEDQPAPSMPSTSRRSNQHYEP